MLAQLKDADFDARPYESFVIEPSAHADVLSQVGRFVHSPYYRLTFQGADGSQIELQPRTRHVKADFKAGNHSLQPLPSTYYSYHLIVSRGAVLDPDGVDSFCRSKTASDLWIEGEHGLALALQQNRFLRRLRRMKRIRIDVSPATHEQLQLEAFAKAILLLERVTFVPTGITEDQFRAFADRQVRPSGWACYDADGGNGFTCARRTTPSKQAT